MTNNYDILTCYECGERIHRPRHFDDGDFTCPDCEAVHRAKRGDQPQRLAQSITLSLTPQQFTYLQAAVKRDLDMLEEMAPWDIDDHTEEHERETRLCRSMIAMLAKVEQTQVVPQ